MLSNKIVLMVILSVLASVISYFTAGYLTVDLLPVGRLVSSKSTEVDLGGNVVRVPAEWGKVLKVEHPLGEYYGPDYYAVKIDKIPYLYIVDFANDIVGYFQDGLDLVYYRKGRERKNCGEVFERFFEESIDRRSGGVYVAQDDNDDIFDNDCVRIEDGIFNLSSGRLTVFGQKFSYWGDSIHTGGPYSDFEFFDRLGKKQKGFFSPRGTYVANAGVFYEGCGNELKDTITGRILSEPSDDGDSLEEESLTLGCTALLNFSDDENTFVVRDAGIPAVTEGFYSSFFIVSRGNRVDKNVKVADILSKLAPEEFYSGISSASLYNDQRRVDAKADFKIIFVTDKEVKFDILKDTSLHYKTGSYVYNILKDQIIKQ